MSTLLTHAIAVAIGAVPGALARFYLTEWCRRTIGPDFPYGTLLINLTGCGAIGFFVGFAARVALPPELSLFCVTGFLGAYTTFSTYELEAWQLVRNGRGAIGLFYWISSIVLGVLAVQVGLAIAQSP